MKHTLLFSFSLLCCLPFVGAQITLSADDYYPVVGDTLEMQFVLAPQDISVTASGSDQNWDFSDLTGGTLRTRIIQAASDAPNAEDFPNADVFDVQLAGSNYYRATDESFALVGFNGEDPLGQGLQVSTPFSPAYVERWGSLEFFDLNTFSSALTLSLAADDIPGGIFDALPISPDSIRVRVAIDRTDLVDAWGTITIPGGEYEVLREKRTEIRDVRLDAKIGFLPWTDITDTALGLLPIDQLGQDTTNTYIFWSNEAKEAIVEIEMNADESSVNSIAYKFNDIINSTNDLWANNQARLTIYPNPATDFAHLKFSDLRAGDYQVDIYNLTGKKVWSKDYYINGHGQHKINVSNLPKGFYLCQLKNENGKAMLTQRLVIGG